ncbi:hypothetical protein B0T24DRAFT_17414 [Lasiosphaeria ovina]|uniref:DUF676 domain-containing protein n=1 Tax=Lasiosphaeria ovina TaxID=92902 RepID=A0AAE0NJ76_9PEZI|nr:hypothetical protein B0T24DRAFT_17414 [Lasiosphaeria ovina]
MASSNAVVYRLQGIPNFAKTFEDVVNLLRRDRKHLYDAYEPEIFSLATNIPHARGLAASKVATLMFNPRHPTIRRSPRTANAESILDTTLGPEQILKVVNGVRDGLVLDKDFLGLTPLNDAAEGGHEHDFIAISGIGSHPFGSWQAHGGDKRFMWLRDALPTTFPFTRVLLYGYKTELQNSKSFQRIPDIARTLITFIESLSRSSERQRPIVFIAHSLGGIVLQEALVQLTHTISHVKDLGYLLEKVVGAIFFGVPNQGMAIEHLLSLADRNPNHRLIEDIKPHSRYLDYLGPQFEQKLSGKIFLWGYETRESRIPVVSLLLIHQCSH